MPIAIASLPGILCAIALAALAVSISHHGHVGLLGAVALLGLAALFGSQSLLLFRSRRHGARLQEQAARAQGESQEAMEALNWHAIVCTTNHKAQIISVNERFLEITGWSRDEVIDQPAKDFYPPEERHMVDEAIVQLQRGGHWQGETRLLCRDGGSIWTRATISPRRDCSGRLCGAVSVRTDITEIKSAAAEREMAASLRHLSDEVYIFDAVTLAFRYLNEAARQRTGWTFEACQDHTVYDILPDFDMTKFGRTVAPLLRGESEQVMRVLTLHGTQYEARVQYVEPAVGARRFVIILRDISERYEIERIKDEFIATVSHELRSPLTSIKGSMGLILAGATGEISEKARRMLEIAHRNADRLVLIVNDILDLEKIAAGRMDFHIAEGDLCEVIREAVQANQAFADRYQVVVRMEGLTCPVPAEFDANRIFQVMTNLLSNAAKFSDPGGKVLVKVEPGRIGPRVTVRDFGEGIPLAAQAKIFERFSQADSSDQRAKGGTGLGLAIVKAILERHDATLDFESAEGKGTRFTFELRQSEPAAEGAWAEAG